MYRRVRKYLDEDGNEFKSPKERQAKKWPEPIWCSSKPH